MKKRIFSKILALLMALSLLSTTAFAACFTDLQDAINGKGDTDDNLIGEGRYGYGRNEETNTWGIEAWTTKSEDGTSTRNVQLNENVEYDAGKDAKTPQIVISTGNVNIDLNDQTIDDKHNNGDNAIVRVTSSSGVTIKNGTITGGSKKNGIRVAASGTLYLEDVNLTDNGNGIWASDSSKLVVSGGNFCDNKARGIVVTNNAQADISHVTISGTEQCGLGVSGNAKVTISDSSIINNGSTTNSQGYGGGIAMGGGTLNLKDVIITGNSAGCDGGGIAFQYGKNNVTIEGDCQIYGNTAGEKADDIFIAPGTTITGLSSVNSNIDITDEEGHSYNGWYIDEYRPRWSENAVSEEFTDIPDVYVAGEYVHLKYAHNKYYTVTVDPANGTDATTGEFEFGKTDPQLPEVDPTRPGYNFEGWFIADEDGNPTEKEFDPEDIDGNDIVLVAKWSEDPDYVPPETEDPDDTDDTDDTGNGGTPDPDVTGTPDNPYVPTIPTEPVTPTPTPAPTVITDNDVPQSEIPEELTEEPADESEEPEEPVEIIDEELPLTEMPEIPEIPEETEIPEEPTAIVIEEDDVPLSDVPQTGEASTAMWLAVLLASGMGLVYLNTGKRKENA